ncbi:MAG: hypothetical protein QM626_10735 [Microbacterium sp.]|uniref:hypothetical protein n=1 Tax=Microbacterium sp. TaxID=51671 RepID=UPI0039E651E7
MSDPRAEPAQPEPAASAPRLEPPSPEVALPAAATVLPGEHRGGFTTPPTAPIDMAALEAHAWEPDAGAPAAVAEPAVPWRPGVYALVFAISGLAASIVVGWAFPLGVIGVVLGVVAARRRDQRSSGIWAIVLAAASLVYSAGWLVYALTR